MTSECVIRPLKHLASTYLLHALPFSIDNCMMLVPYKYFDILNKSTDIHGKATHTHRYIYIWTLFLWAADSGGYCMDYIIDMTSVSACLVHPTLSVPFNCGWGRKGSGVVCTHDLRANQIAEFLLSAALAGEARLIIYRKPVHERVNELPRRNSSLWCKKLGDTTLQHTVSPTASFKNGFVNSAIELSSLCWWACTFKTCPVRGYLSLLTIQRYWKQLACFSLSCFNPSQTNLLLCWSSRLPRRCLNYSYLEPCAR